ncbi:MAG: glycosyltransferase family 61 protein [Alphaproteobacteria bacterium]|nr:glycosyltransferase family 61 protein [Alphaproteobacteria bacterium]
MKLQCYIDDVYQKYFMAEKSKLQPHDVDIEEYQNATMVVDTKTFGFGIFDADGRFIKSSCQWRGNNHQYVPKFVKDAEYMDCDAMFLGNAYAHFGHFLIEHLNRAWGVVRAGKPGMKYVLIDNKNNGAKEFMYVFLEMLGIARDDIIILNKPMRFRRVFIPHQTMNISNYRHAAEFILPFQQMRENVSADKVYERVYVSRAKLPDSIRTYGEDKVQKIFEKNGFHVIYPETLSLMQQAAIVGNAKILAGCAGSALHLSVFMKPGGRVIQLRRTFDIHDSGPLQYRLCLLGGLDFDVISASVEEFETTHGGSHAPQIIGVNKYLRQFFDENGFKYDDDDLIMDKDILVAYRAQVESFKASHGGKWKLKLKKKFIKLSACLIPGRVWRGRYRTYMKKLLGTR